MNCEICGNKIIDIITIRIDTGILRVCNSCSRLGKQMSSNLNSDKKRIIRDRKNSLDLLMILNIQILLHKLRI